jgi:VIT1/CCC1 family predicted Fe2+/Mn2+ transporter
MSERTAPVHHVGHEDHRGIGGGQARAAVFGFSDGLVSNVSLVLGVAGSSAGADFVRLAGIAGLVAGGVSMAAGEYVSMQAQRELLERELAIERRELATNPEAETRELAAIYRARGVKAETAQTLAEEMMRDPEVALEVHAREELGVDPSDLGSPVGAAAASLVAFAAGALIPVIPWFLGSGTAAIVTSLVLGLVAALIAGAVLGVVTERSRTRSALRQAGIMIGASAVTYAIGAAIGVSV